MRHRKRSRRLVSKWEHRQALMRNLLNSLFTHERITTTLAKAKELRRVADKMITLAKRGDLHARRQALAVLQNKELVRKLFAEAKEKFGDRQGGYTRIVRVGPRRGDAAMMAIVELVAEKLEHRRSKKKIAADREAMASKAEEVKAVESEAPEVQAPEATEAEKTTEVVEEPSLETSSPEAEATSEASAAEASGEEAETSSKEAAAAEKALDSTDSKAEKKEV